MLLIFQLINFINIEHQFASLIKTSTKSKLAEIAFDHSRSKFFIDIDRTRAFSKTSDLSRFWSLEWATNKSLFRRFLKRFENCFSNLCRKHSENQSFKHFILEQNRRSNMISTSEFFSTNVNQTTSISQNQTKNDRIIVIVTRTFETYFRNKKATIVSASFTFNANSNNYNSESTDDARISIREWTCDDIEFFDFSIDDIASIINVEKHVFYKDIYAFIDRLKNMIVHKKSDKLRNVISQCFKKFVLIWHSTKL